MPDSTVPYTLDLLNKNTTMTKLPNFLSSCKTNTNAAKPDSVFLATSPACAPSQSVSLLAPEAQLRESEWHTSVPPFYLFIYFLSFFLGVLGMEGARRELPEESRLGRRASGLRHVPGSERLLLPGRFSLPWHIKGLICSEVAALLEAPSRSADCRRKVWELISDKSRPRQQSWVCQSKVKQAGL